MSVGSFLAEMKDEPDDGKSKPKDHSEEADAGEDLIAHAIGKEKKGEKKEEHPGDENV